MNPVIADAIRQKRRLRGLITKRTTRPYCLEDLRVPRHDGHDSGLMADSIPE
jgi:hypothetical protein